MKKQVPSRRTAKENKISAKSKLINEIWAVLNCTEPQTKKVIEQFLDDIALFDKKQRDYGTNNINKFGVLGILVRVSDKVERLINLHKKSNQSRSTNPEANEPMLDSWADITVYGAIARIVSEGNWSKET